MTCLYLFVEKNCHNIRTWCWVRKLTCTDGLLIWQSLKVSSKEYFPYQHLFIYRIVKGVTTWVFPVKKKLLTLTQVDSWFISGIVFLNNYVSCVVLEDFCLRFNFIFIVNSPSCISTPLRYIYNYL